MTIETPGADTLEALRRLIAFDTTSRNSNLALIDWAEARLVQHGARVRRSYDAKRSKANLFASFGEGPGGVVLSGHSDVVQVDGQTWSSDPFQAEIRDDRLYGRGACDMKGFIGVVLAQAPAMARARLRQPVHVAISYDEEVGCLGIRPLLDDLAQAGIRPDGCIVGEPTSMRMVTAHRGGHVYRCRVHGRAAHSSLTPSGVNAIEYAARLIAFIQEMAEREAAQGQRLDGLDVPYSTISTNMISGGSGTNIVPASCEFVFDYRFVPGVAPDAFIDAIRAYAAEQLEPRMREAHGEAGIAFERIGEVLALDADEQERIARLARSLLRDTATAKVSYGTEAGFFLRAGIPSIVRGPGSIEQAHRPDEYVALEQLRQCERFVEALLARLSAEPSGAG